MLPSIMLHTAAQVSLEQPCVLQGLATDDTSNEQQPFSSSVCELQVIHQAVPCVNTWRTDLPGMADGASHRAPCSCTHDASHERHYGRWPYKYHHLLSPRRAYGCVTSAVSANDMLFAPLTFHLNPILTSTALYVSTRRSTWAPYME